MNSKIFDGFKELINPGYVFHKILKKDLEETSKLTRGTLLDVSCGKKPYKEIFQNKVNYYVGIDLPSTAYGISEVDVFSDALQLSFRERCFDVVLAIQLLEHLPEPQKFFSEIHRVLKSGGILILTVPLVNPVHEVPNDFLRYTFFGLVYWAQKMGFKIMKVKEQGGICTILTFLLGYYIWDATAQLSWGLRNLIRTLAAPLQLFALLDDSIFQNKRYAFNYCLTAQKV